MQLVRKWLFFYILLKTSRAIEVGEVLGYWYCEKVLIFQGVQRIYEYKFFEMELRIFCVLVEFMSGFEKRLDFSRNFKGEMLDFDYFVSNGYKENA